MVLNQNDEEEVYIIFPAKKKATQTFVSIITDRILKTLIYLYHIFNTFLI